MSGEGWAALILLVFVLLFLVALGFLVRATMRNRRLDDGARRYHELERTDWFRSEERMSELRDRMRRTVAQEDQRVGPPPPAPKRSAEELYGDRVRGGDDGDE